MMPNVNVPLVDGAGLPTRAFVHLLAGLTGGNSGSVPARLTALEGDVASLQALTTAQGAAISGLVSDVTAIDVQIAALTDRISDEEVRSLWVTPWP